MFDPDEIHRRIMAQTQISEGCWLWKGQTTPAGYAIMNFNGNKRALVTRVWYTAWNGKWPARDVYMCHRCDNPRCVNPHHLFIGSAKSNARDAATKGRMGKLTAQQVVQLRQDWASGMRPKDVAAKYGMTPTNAWRAATGVTYPGIGGPITRSASRGMRRELEPDAEMVPMLRKPRRPRPRATQPTAAA